MSRSPRWAGSLAAAAVALVLAAPSSAEEGAAPGAAPERAAPLVPELPGTGLPEGVEDGIAFAWKLVQLAAFLAGLSALGFLAARVLGPKLGALHGRPGDLIKVVERRPLDAKTVLYVVEVAGRHALIAVSEHEVKALSSLELDDARIREALAAAREGAGGAPPRVPGGAAFAQVLAEGRARPAPGAREMGVEGSAAAVASAGGRDIAGGGA